MTHFENAYITGASSGIGRALALELARRGTRVVATARRLGRLETLVHEIRACGGCAEAERLDVRDAAAVFASIARWDAELGGLDLVIANAGVGSVVSAEYLAWEDVSNLLAVNVAGAFATLIAGKDVLLPRGRGTLVGVSSLAGVRALPGSGAYSASKAALQTFLETLELDLTGTGLTVVDIQPGFVRSEMTDKNDFEMPYLLEVEDAVRRCVDGIEGRTAVVSFPWQLAWPLKCVGRFLPRVLWRLLASRMRPPANSPPGRPPAR
jgi:NADP-dependent 3-hydroxy acid dehydrogenase YdfG